MNESAGVGRRETIAPFPRTGKLTFITNRSFQRNVAVREARNFLPIPTERSLTVHSDFTPTQLQFTEKKARIPKNALEMHPSFGCHRRSKEDGEKGRSSEEYPLLHQRNQWSMHRLAHSRVSSNRFVPLPTAEKKISHNRKYLQ